MMLYYTWLPNYGMAGWRRMSVQVRAVTNVSDEAVCHLFPREA